MMEFFIKEVGREGAFHPGRYPINHAYLMVLRVKLWCKKRKYIIFLRVMRLLLIVRCMKCDGEMINWTWRKLVSEENRMSREEDIDFNSFKTRRIGPWIEALLNGSSKDDVIKKEKLTQIDGEGKFIRWKRRR
jgi:hypothetical protein